MQEASLMFKEMLKIEWKVPTQIEKNALLYAARILNRDYFTSVLNFTWDMCIVQIKVNTKGGVWSYFKKGTHKHTHKYTLTTHFIHLTNIMLTQILKITSKTSFNT